MLRFEYDAAGNLLEKGPAADATTPAAGRLRLSYDRHGGGPVNVASVERHDGTTWVSGAASYSQNPSGAVTDFTKLGASTTLFRDADERVQAVVAAGPAYNHYYDIAGQRTSKVRSSWGVILEARHYVDPGFEVDPIAETHEVHLFVGARRVATSKRPGLGMTATATADAVEYYHPDHVGSNTLVTNAAGEVVQETVTTPFGELRAIVDGAGTAVSPQDSTTRYLFTDQEHDPETGLHYFGARFQDPWIGRFMSQDPELVGASAGVVFGRIEGDGQSLNPYSYSLNRPTVLTDPTGRVPWFVMGMAGPGCCSSDMRKVVGEGELEDSEATLDGNAAGISVVHPRNAQRSGSTGEVANEATGTNATGEVDAGASEEKSEGIEEIIITGKRFPSAVSFGYVGNISVIAGPNGFDLLGYFGLEGTEGAVDVGYGGTFAGQLAGRGVGEMSGFDIDADFGLFVSRAELEELEGFETSDLSLIMFNVRLWHGPGGFFDIRAVSAGRGLGCCGSKVRDAAGGHLTFESVTSR